VSNEELLHSVQIEQVEQGMRLLGVEGDVSAINTALATALDSRAEVAAMRNELKNINSLLSKTNDRWTDYFHEHIDQVLDKVQGVHRRLDKEMATKQDMSQVEIKLERFVTQRIGVVLILMSAIVGGTIGIVEYLKPRPLDTLELLRELRKSESQQQSLRLEKLDKIYEKIDAAYQSGAAANTGSSEKK